MKNILNSASKLVFLLMTIAVIAGLFLGKVTSEQFIALATMTFAFYFGTRAKTDLPNTPTAQS